MPTQLTQTNSAPAPSAEASQTSRLAVPVIETDPMRRMKASIGFSQSMFTRAIFAPNVSRQSAREILSDPKRDISPEAGVELVRWRMYCTMIFLHKQQLSPEIEPIHPMPLAYSPRVTAAQERMIENHRALSKRFGNDHAAIARAQREAMADDEIPRPAKLTAASEAERAGLMDRADQDCSWLNDKSLGEARQSPLAAVRQGSSPVGEYLRARSLPAAEGDEYARSQRLRALDTALTRVFETGDWAAMTLVAMQASPPINWAEFGAGESAGFQPYAMMGGQAAAALALCNLGDYCGADSYWARTVCLDYGACEGGSLAERWRNALSRDGLPSNMFDRAAEALTAAFTSGNAQALGVRR